MDHKGEIDTIKIENHSGHNMGNQEMKGMDMSNDGNMQRVNKKHDTPYDFNDSLNMSSLVMPTSFRVISSQKSGKPMQGGNGNAINVNGYIAIDERRNNKVSVRISGRIEKLYIKYNFQYVKKGDKIMSLYSPELNTYQEELLFLVKRNTDHGLIDKAEEKLRLLGVTQTQINNVKKTGNIFHTITVYNPHNGYVIFKPSETVGMSSGINYGKSTTTTMGGSMQTNNTSNNVSSENGQIREGIYINKGDLLFWVNDLQEVWGMVAVDNSHEQELKTGAKISVVSELYKNDTIDAVINFIEPFYQENQKFIMARIYLKNTNNKYKINSLLEAKIYSGSKYSLMVPYSSVLFLGKRKMVWVLKGMTSGYNRIYEAKDVTIGVMYDGMVEIKSGLSAGEQVAINAGYLMDRESLIKPE